MFFSQINIDPEFVNYVFQVILDNLADLSSGIINSLFSSVLGFISLISSIGIFIIKLGIGYAIAFLMVRDFGGKNKKINRR